MPVREFDGALDAEPTVKEFDGLLDPAAPTKAAAALLPKSEPTLLDRAATAFNRLIGNGSVMDDLPANMVLPAPTPESTQLATAALEHVKQDRDLALANEAARRQSFARTNPNLAALAAGSAKALSSTMDMAPLAADTVNQYIASPVLSLVGAEPYSQAPRLPGAAKLDQATEQFTPKAATQSLKAAWNRDEMIPWLTANVLQQAPQAAQSIGAAFLPEIRAASLLTMGGQAAGAKYTQNKAEGYERGAALSDALVNGNIEVLSEMLPLHAFDKVKDVILRLPAPVRGQVLTNAFKRLAASGGAVTAQGITGAIEEGVAQLGDNASENVVLGKDTPLMDQVPESAVIGAVAGKIMGLPHAATAFTEHTSPQHEIAHAIDQNVANVRYAQPADVIARNSLNPDNAQVREFTGELDAPPVTSTAPQQSASVEVPRQPTEPSVVQRADVDAPSVSNTPSATGDGADVRRAVAQVAQEDANPRTTANPTLLEASPDAFERQRQDAQKPAVASVVSDSIIADALDPDAQLQSQRVAAAKIPKDAATTAVQVEQNPQATQKPALTEQPAPAEPAYAQPAMIDGTRAQQLGSPSNGLRPGDIVTANGAPFANKSAAQKIAKEAGPGWQVKKGAGGFVVRHQPASEKQIAAGKKAAQREARIDTSKHSMFNAIARLGGLSRDAATREWGFDPAEFKNLRGGIRPVVRANGGLGLDAMAERLAELGYLSRDEQGKHDLSEFFDLFDGELRGNKHYTPEGFDAMMQQAHQDQYEEWLSEEEGKTFDALPADHQDFIEEGLDRYGDALTEDDFTDYIDALGSEALAIREGSDPVRHSADEEANAGDASETRGETPTQGSAGQRAADASERPDLAPPKPRTIREELAQAKGREISADPDSDIPFDTSDPRYRADKRSAAQAAEDRAHQKRLAVQRRYEQDADANERDWQLKKINEDLAKELRQADGADDVPFSSAGQKSNLAAQRRGMSVEAVREAINGDAFDHDVDVYPSFADAPEYVRMQASKEEGGGVEGFWDMAKNRVALIAENLDSADRARAVARHELIGHYGLENMLQDSADPDLMSILVKRVIRAEQDGNKVIADLAAQVDRTQPGLSEERRAKEIIAVMAERNIQNSITKRVLDAIRKFLVKHGIIRSETTDADIAQLLRQTQEYLRAQGREMVAGEPASAFSRDHMTPIESGTPLTRDDVLAKQDALARAAREEQTAREPAERNVTADQADLFNTQGSLFSRAAPVNSEAFKRWFGDSKVVDADGKPLVVYHGTRADFSSFSTDQAGSASEANSAKGGFFFATNRDTANTYATAKTFADREKIGAAQSRLDALIDGLDDYDNIPPSVQKQIDKQSAVLDRLQDEYGRFFPDGANVVPAYVSIKNPLIVDMAGYSEKSFSEIISQAKSGGHDGVIIRNTTDDAHYSLDEVAAEPAKTDLIIAFSPEQIKSAAGNNGNFNPNDARIAFSRKGGADGMRIDRSQDELPFAPRATFNTPDPGVVDNVMRAMQDNKIDLKRVQQAIKDAGGTVTENQDAYLNEELYIGRVTDQIDRFVDSRVTPLLEAIHKAGLTLDETNQFLYARHAPERNAQLQKLQPHRTNSDRLSGMSDAKAAEIIQGFREAGKYDKLQKIAGMVDDITRENRRRIVSAGLEPADMIARWEAVYRHYVPLMADMDVQIGRKKGGFNVKGPESERSLGQLDESQNILANVIAQAQSTIMRAEKAKVARSLLDLARNHPNDKFWKVDQPPKKRRINPDTGLVEWVQDPLFKTRDNVLVVKENGIEHYITFNEKNERAMRLAASMQNLDTAELPWLIDATGKLTRHLAMWITARNPLFWLTNFTRDAQGVLFNLQDTELAGKEGSVLKNMLPAMRGYRDFLRGEGNSKWAGYAREFKAAGSETGFVKVFDSPEDHMADLQKQLDQMKQGNADPRKLARTLVEAIDDYNTIIENGVRLSVYQTARQNGVSVRKAATMAKNITVNFNRKGSQSGMFNALYMFFNASVQGNARFLTAIAHSRRAQAVSAALVGAGFLMDAVGRAIGGDDDETGQHKYDEIPEFERQRNWIFMDPRGSGKYIKIPMPYGPHIMLNVGRMLSEMAFGPHKDAIEQATTLAALAVDSFNPLGSNGSLSQYMAPSVLKPIVQINENKSFTGGPLYKAPSEFGSYEGPAYTRQFRSTGEHWTEASKLLSDVSGGDKIAPGKINVPPEVLRTLVTSYLAPGITQNVDRAVTTAEASAAGNKVEPSQIPGLSRFYGEAPEERAQERNYYEQKRKIDEQIGRIKQYAKAGDRDGMNRALTELGDGDRTKGMQIRAKWDAAEKALMQMNRARSRLETDDVPDDKQRVQLDRIDERRMQLIRRVLR
jgi:hypothetical protein